MKRSLFASVFVTAGLAWTACVGLPVVAAGQEPQGSAAPARDQEQNGPARRIDQAILAYESRADQELDQTRKDIARLQKELGDMVELQFGLAISLAELQAEMRVQAATAAAADLSAESAGSGASAANQADEQRRLRTLELSRELRAVMENLRGVVSQKRNETDQLIVQLRNLRAEQRRMAADRERNKTTVRRSQD
jgi:hypothetical protein